MASSLGTVLVVDDDEAVRMPMVAQLGQAKVEALEATDGVKALEVLASHPVDVVVTDLRMPGMDGMQLLERIARDWPEVPVIMITAHGTVEAAVEAMKKGAADFLLKNGDRDELFFVVRKALEKARRSTQATAPVSQGGLWGDSPAMAEVRATLAKVAPQTATVLLRGENGTGKEVAARWVHQQSPRKAGPFVPIHCAALPDTLIESELFGYEKGAFTGAVARKPGRVELANGGTLFLDEIGDVPKQTQVKLLRLIQEKKIERLGGTGQPIDVDVRIIAATHRPLEEMVKQGEFREDLFFRLSVVPVVMPPLRDRAGDVAVLAQRFAETLGKANNRPGFRLGPEALALLAAQKWPGNVRELQNFVERLVVMAETDAVGAADVQRELGRGNLGQAAAPVGSDLESRRAQVEKEALVEALQRSNNNRTLAARILGVSRRTLYNMLAAHGL